jgi:hypothetical protein
MNKSQLRTDIEQAINRNSAENGSDTPDFILAEYLMICLEAFDKITSYREQVELRDVMSTITMEMVTITLHRWDVEARKN